MMKFMTKIFKKPAYRRGKPSEGLEACKWNTRSVFHFPKGIMLLLCCIAALSLTCKDEPTKPPDDNKSDTTSHDFSWTITQLGDGSSSVLYDVAIINDTCVWAVGEIWQGGITYNAAKWNGNNWQLKQLYYNGSDLIVPIRGIVSFGAYDIWLAAGGVFHWNGISSQAPMSFSRLTLPDPNATIEKLWGSSSSDLYGIGNAGTIVHYNGSTWTKIESGTTLSINDIYGAYNSATSQWEILAVASNQFQNQGKKVLRIQENSVKVVSDSGLSWAISSIWFVPNEQYYIVGDGIGHKQRIDDETPWSVFPSSAINIYYSGCVSGQSVNDVFVVGSFLEIVHYNGGSWHSYHDVIPYANGGLGRVVLKGNLVLTVGRLNNQALVIIGKR